MTWERFWPYRFAFGLMLIVAAIGDMNPVEAITAGIGIGLVTWALQDKDKEIDK